MAAKKNVSAAEVRAWLRSDEGQAALAKAEVSTTVGSRGRHNPAQVAVFAKAHRGKGYTEKVAEEATVTVKVATIDKTGRKAQRKVTMTNSEARIAMGEPTNKRGRLSTDRLADVLSQREADKFADSFQ